MLMAHKDVLIQFEKFQKKLADHDNDILLIFEYIKRIEIERKQNIEQKNRKKIGFKRYVD